MQYFFCVSVTLTSSVVDDDDDDDAERCRKELWLSSRWSQHERQSAAVTSSLDSLQQQVRALLRDVDKLRPYIINNLVSIVSSSSSSSSSEYCSRNELHTSGAD